MLAVCIHTSFPPQTDAPSVRLQSIASVAKSEQQCVFTIPAEHGLPPSTPYTGGFEEGGACEDGDIWVTLEGSPYQVRYIAISGMEK